jgi:hypothetical protein
MWRFCFVIVFREVGGRSKLKIQTLLSFKGGFVPFELRGKENCPSNP